MVDDEGADPLQSLWQSQPEHSGAFPVEDLRRRARALDRRVRLRNLREYTAAAAVVATCLAVAVSASGTVLLRVACVLIGLGAIHVAVELARRGGARRWPLDATTAEHLAGYRSELERQRQLLESAWRWYVAPFVPGVLLMLVATPLEAPLPDHARGFLWIGSALAAAVCGLVFWAVARLNRSAARQLQREIDRLG